MQAATVIGIVHKENIARRNRIAVHLLNGTNAIAAHVEVDLYGAAPDNELATRIVYCARAVAGLGHERADGGADDGPRTIICYRLKFTTQDF
jgi:hypothetical protein